MTTFPRCPTCESYEKVSDSYASFYCEPCGTYFDDDDFVVLQRHRSKLSMGKSLSPSELVEYVDRVKKSFMISVRKELDRIFIAEQSTSGKDGP